MTDAQKSPATAQREKLEVLSRSLAQLSQSAGYYSLQAKNDHVEVVAEGLIEMKQHLADAEELLRGH
jgi:hypothetical protein